MNNFAKWSGVIIGIVVFFSWNYIRYNPNISSPSKAIQTKLMFEEVTHKLNINFSYEDPTLDPKLKDIQKIFFTGGSLAIADVNNDGFMDILFISSGKQSTNHLYINQSGSHFENRASRWGIANLNQSGASMVPVFFDYDNDGDPDLYIARLGCSMLFENLGDRFLDISHESGIDDCQNSSGAIAYDFDRDGRLDLYVFRYWGPHDFFNLRKPNFIYENLVDAKNGGANTYYKNMGNGRFEDVTEKFGGGDTHWTYDAAIGNFFDEKTPFMYLANDFGADTLYEVSSTGELIDRSDLLGVPDRRLGMSASMGDLDGTGRPQLYISNEYIPKWNQTGNFLWKFHSLDGNTPSRQRNTESAKSRNIANCGWAWGSVFADFDLDGRNDLFVTNGMVSGTSRKHYTFAAGTVTSLPGIIMSDYRNWLPLGNMTFQGHQQSCLFLNKGQKFADVAIDVGLTGKWDGRGAATIDFDNNGTLDLVVATQNGDANAYLFKNNLPARSQWVGFQLTGRVSNRDAIGAKVKLTQNDRHWIGFVTGGKSGYHAISDHRIHFGGVKDEPLEVEIHWPSGVVQQINSLEIGKYHHIVENEISDRASQDDY